MSIISLIAAIDKANGLGVDKRLLCHLPADLQYFKKTTMGKPILMGRTTFDAIGKPLAGRLNIVLSRSQQSIPGVIAYDSIDKALSYLKDIPEIMIIGGEQIYKQTIDRANRLYITQIQHQFKADVFFPKIDESSWVCKNQEVRLKDEKNMYDMIFFIYEKRKS